MVAVPVRLRGGITDSVGTSGRVEVYFEGEWGSVCSDGFTDVDARYQLHLLVTLTYIYNRCNLWALLVTFGVVVCVM